MALFQSNLKYRCTSPLKLVCMIALLKKQFQRALVVIALITISFSSFGQAKKNLEYSGFFDSYYFRGPLYFNVWGGTGFYNGDLCGGLGCNKFGPNAGLGISYKMWPRVHFGADFNYIKLGATDVIESRGLTYSGLNFELMIYGKYFIVEDIIRKHHQMNAKKKPFKPFVLLGFNNLYYVASTTGTSAAGYTPSPALGIGAEIHVKNNIKVSPEFTYRYLFSDNLEGVAAGSSKDSYLTAGVRISYTPYGRKKKRRKLKEDELQAIQKMVDESGSDTTSGSSSGSGADSTGTSGGSEVEEDDANDYLNDLLQRPDVEEETEDEGTEEESEYYEGEDEEPKSEDDEGEYYEGDDEESEPEDSGSDDSGGWDDSGW